MCQPESQVFELVIPVNNEVTAYISVFVSFSNLFTLIVMSSDIENAH